MINNGQSAVETGTYRPRWIDPLVQIGSVMAWIGIAIWTIQGFDWQYSNATPIFAGLALELIASLWIALGGSTKTAGLWGGFGAIIVVLMGTVWLAITGVRLLFPRLKLPQTKELTLDMEKDVQLDHGDNLGWDATAVITCPGCGKELHVPDLWNDGSWHYMTHAGYTPERYGNNPSHYREMQVLAHWKKHRVSGKCHLSPL